MALPAMPNHTHERSSVAVFWRIRFGTLCSVTGVIELRLYLLPWGVKWDMHRRGGHTRALVTFSRATVAYNWEVPKNPHRAWLRGQVREGVAGWGKTCPLFF